MNASHVCMTLVFSLLIASSLFEQAAADVFNTEQKGLLKDLAKGAGGVFQQIIATRGSIRTAEVQAQAQATAAAAAAAAARPPLPQNLVPVNPGPALQAPQFRQGPFQGPVAQFQPVGAGGPYRPPYQGPYQGPYRGQGQYQGYNGYPGQQGYPQQGPVPPAAVPFQGGTQGNPVIQGNQGNQGNQVNQVNRGVPNGPDACSATETSPQAVSVVVSQLLCCCCINSCMLLLDTLPHGSFTNILQLIPCASSLQGGKFSDEHFRFIFEPQVFVVNTSVATGSYNS